MVLTGSTGGIKVEWLVSLSSLVKGEESEVRPQQVVCSRAGDETE